MADQFARFVLLFGPFLALGVLVVILRWTFGTARDVPAPHLPDPDDPTGFGLLEEASRVPTAAAADVLRARLVAAGVRATISRADEGGYRLLVFPVDLVAARVVLNRGARE
jgi:hypothetical protein